MSSFVSPWDLGRTPQTGCLPASRRPVPANTRDGAVWVRPQEGPAGMFRDGTPISVIARQNLHIATSFGRFGPFESFRSFARSERERRAENEEVTNDPNDPNDLCS